MGAYNFSVAMCTYNGARFLNAQLASIAGQTQLPAELIVCDDGSRDDSVRFVTEFAKSVSFPVRIHVNEKNLGVIANFGVAISLCGGDVIALADQDDVWASHKIERLDAEFRSSESIGLVFSDGELMDDDSKLLGTRLWESVGIQQTELERIQKGSLTNGLLCGSIVTGATMAFRGGFRELVLPIPENLALIHDGWIALLISAVARISVVREPLVKYRQHTAQQIGALARKVPEGGRTGALNRSNPYPEALAIVRTMRQRLLDKRDAFDANKLLPDLETRIAHLEMRADLPNHGGQRAKAVLRELFALRYHRYSSGVSSALKDLMA